MIHTIYKLNGILKSPFNVSTPPIMIFVIFTVNPTLYALLCEISKSLIESD